MNKTEPSFKEFLEKEKQSEPSFAEFLAKEKAAATPPSSDVAVPRYGSSAKKEQAPAGQQLSAKKKQAPDTQPSKGKYTFNSPLNETPEGSSVSEWVAKAFQAGIADVFRRNADVLAMEREATADRAARGIENRGVIGNLLPTTEELYAPLNLPKGDSFINLGPESIVPREQQKKQAKEAAAKRLEAVDASRENRQKKWNEWAGNIDPGEYQQPTSAVGKFMHDFIRNSPYTLQSMAASVPAFMFGGPVGGAAASIMLANMEAEHEMSDVYKTLKGKGMSPHEAQTQSNKDYLANMALLTASNYLQGRVTAGMGNAVKEALVAATEGRAPSDAVSKAAAQIMKSAIGRKLLTTKGGAIAAITLFDMFSEGAEEGSQNVVSSLTKGEPIDWRQTGYEAALGAASGALFGGAGGALSLVRDNLAGDGGQSNNAAREAETEIIKNAVQKNATPNPQTALQQSIQQPDQKAPTAHPVSTTGAANTLFRQIVEDLNSPDSAMNIKPEDLIFDTAAETIEDLNAKIVNNATGGVGAGEQTLKTEAGGATAQPNAASVKQAEGEFVAPGTPTIPITGAGGVFDFMAQLKAEQEARARAGAKARALMEAQAMAAEEEKEAETLAKVRADAEQLVAEQREAIAKARQEAKNAASAEQTQQDKPTLYPVRYRNGEKWGATPVSYEVIEADDLITSNNDSGGINEKYPAELQPRDRTRMGGLLQVEQMARDLNPDMLGPSAESDRGAPIIDKNNNVISGNGRTMAIRSAYKNMADSSGRRYRDYLGTLAEKYGVDPNVLSGMKKPVLVRRLADDALDLKAFAEDANNPTVASMSGAERAKNDAEKLTPGILSKFIPNDTGDILTGNGDFIQAFSENVVTRSEMNTFIDREGKLSQDGVRRIKNALVAKAYGDSAFTERMSESTDDNMRNLTNALTQAAPAVAKVEERMEQGFLDSRYSIRKPLIEAVKRLENIRENGETVAEALEQTGLFNTGLSPEAKIILQYIDNNKRSMNNIRKFLMDYAVEVENKGDPKQKSMFDDEPESLNELLKRMIAKQGQTVKGMPSSASVMHQGTLDFYGDNEKKSSAKTTEAKIEDGKPTPDQPIQNASKTQEPDQTDVEPEKAKSDEIEASTKGTEGIEGTEKTKQPERDEVQEEEQGNTEGTQEPATGGYERNKSVTVSQKFASYSDTWTTPWGGAISFNGAGKAQYDFKRGVYHGDYNGGSVYIADVRPGDIVAFGQKNKRNSQKTKNDWFVVENDGGLTAIRRDDAYQHYLKIQEQDKAKTEQPSEKDILGNAENKNATEGNSDFYATEWRKQSTPQLKLAKLVYDTLQSGEHIKNNVVFSKMANEAWGGTQAQGTYDMSQAYDAMEMGVNMFLAKSGMVPSQMKTVEEVRAAIKFVESKVLAHLPTMTSRSERKETFQQFSTPPNYSIVANWLLGAREGDVVLEPSAGIGGLAVYAKNSGAEVIVNELDPERGAVLKTMGFDRVFNENAEQLDNILPDDVKPNKVIMNPPFSSTAGRTNTNSTRNVFPHIEQALSRLEDGGRAVMILGKGMAEGATKLSDAFWNKIKKDYNVRANVELSGEDYAKYGTSYGNVIVVVDKTGPTMAKGFVSGSFKNLDEALDVLEGVARDGNTRREKTTGRPEQASGKEGSVGSRAAEDRPKGVVVQSSVASDSGISARATGTGGHGDSVHNGLRPESQSDGAAKHEGGEPRPDRPDDKRTDVVGEQEDGGNGAKPGLRDGRMYSDAGRIPSGARPERSGEHGGRVESSGDEGRNVGSRRVDGDNLATKSKDEIIKETAEARPDEKSDEMVFDSYVSAVKGPEHPADLDEPAAMAAIQAPPITAKLNLDKAMLEDGRISAPQQEMIARAVQSFDTINPDGTRRGFFVGDGTGVGKGREISGVILHGLNSGWGNGKAVWLSVKHDLMDDARRDWAGLGGKAEDIFSHKATTKKKLEQRKSGVIFSAYSLYKDGSGKSGLNKRLEELAGWLGKDFDGVIALDECHNVNNVMDERGRFGVVKSAKSAVNIRDFVRMFPNARILYVSATGATELKNLAMLERLGLWGDGTAFPTLSDFMNKIGGGGMASLELVARDMKALGVYLARSLSFRAGKNGGPENVTFSRMEHALDEYETAVYNEIANAWSVCLQNLNEAMAITHSSTTQAKTSQFWGSMQRCMNQVLTALSVPDMISSIDKDIANGNSVVVQITNTNEASQNRAAEKLSGEEDTADDLDVTPRDALMGYLENGFPIYQYQEVVDEDGKSRMEIVKDSKGDPVINKEALKKRDQMLENIKSIRFPDSPLDMIIKHFGVRNVAEVTGRSKRPNYEHEGKDILVKRENSANKAETDAFQRGDKRILIFSEAGGTGFSYHADKSKKNQQKRIHYVLQPGWRAATAIQGIGRTNRSNQAHKPHVVLATTNVPGQKRFTSTIARRLEQLGALTLGDRAAQNKGLFSASDNLESKQSQAAVNRLLERIDTETLDKLGLPHSVRNSGTPISKFLNRLLALDVARQNEVFDNFSGLLNTEIERATANGTLDTGVMNLHANSLEVEEDSIVYQDGGIETHYMKLKAGFHQEPVQFKKHDTSKDVDFMGYYFQKKAEGGKGRVVAVFRGTMQQDEKGRYSQMYALRGVDPKPHNRISGEVLGNTNAFEKLTEEQAEKRWKAESAALPRMRYETIHMITGAILPVYNLIGEGLGGGTVYKERLKDGSSILGLRVSDKNIKLVLRNLQSASGSQIKGAVTTAEEAIGNIVNNNARYTLINGWQLKPAIVNGETRIELIGPDFYKGAAVSGFGIKSEKIGHTNRYFIPTGNTEAMKALLKYSPINEDKTYTPEPKFSLSSEAAPASATFDVTPKNVRELFGGKANVSRMRDGSIIVSLPNNRKVNISTTGNIRLDEKAVREAYGAKAAMDVRNGKRHAVGSFDLVDGVPVIELLNGEATNFTANHEVFHLAAAMALSKPQWDTLVKHYGVSGETRARQDEVLADKYAEFREGRMKGSRLIRSIWEKLVDFCKNIRAFATGQSRTQSAKDVFRDIESGRVWNQGADGNFTGRKFSIEGLKQAISSANTSLRQVAAIFKKVAWKPGTVNIDIGGGRYDEGTKYLAEKGVENLIYDPYNRDETYNRFVVGRLMKRSGDTATVNNVLNVIAEADVRKNVVLQAAKAIKKDGVAYFQIYEGDGSGVGKQTSKGWQNNRKTQEYVAEVATYFDKTTQRGNIIEATSPKFSRDEKAIWQLDGSGRENIRYSLEGDKSVKSEQKGKENTTEPIQTPQEVVNVIKGETEKAEAENQPLSGEDVSILSGLGLEQVVAPPTSQKKKLTFRERMMELYAKNVDDLKPIDWHFGKGIFRMAGNAIYGAGSKARARMLWGDKERGVKGLEQIWESLPFAERTPFSYYCVLMHLHDVASNTMKAVEEIKQLKKKFKDATVEEKKEIIKTVEALKKQIKITKATPEAYEKAIRIFEEKYPNWKQAQRDVVKYNQALLDLLAKERMIGKDFANELKKRYPNYVPLQRDMGTEAGMSDFIQSGGVVNVANPLKTLKGSRRDVIDPLNQMISNTFMYESTAARQHVARAIVDGYDRGEYRDLIQEVYTKEGLMQRAKEAFAKAKEAETEEEKEALLEQGRSYVAHAKHLKESGDSADKHRADETVFYVYEDGKKRLFRTDKDIAYALTRSVNNDKNVDNILKQICRAPATALRSGTTHSLTYGVGNLFRDTFMYAVVGREFRPIVDTVNGFLALATSKELLQDFVRQGGMQEMSWMSNNRRAELIKEMKGMAEHGWKDNVIITKNPIALYWKLVERFSEMSEMASRLGQYKRLLDKGYSKEDAVYETRDNMNFMRGGQWSRAINQYVAFYNGAIQGVDKMCRELFKGSTWKEGSWHPSVKLNEKTLLRGLKYITLASMLIALYNYSDDDRRETYLNLKPWRKNMFWNIVINKDLTLSIPKPFEPGILFGSVPERFMDYLWANDKRAFDGLANSLKSSLTPDFAPQALSTLFEISHNYSSFYGRQIVPMSEQRLDPDMQYGPYTAEWAKTMGQLLKRFTFLPDKWRSPRVLEFAALSFGGSGIKDISDMYNMAANAMSDNPKPERSLLTVLPGLRKMFTESEFGGRDQEAFRKEVTALYNQARSARERIESGDADSLSLRQQRLFEAYNDIKYLNKILTDRKTGINAAQAEKRRITTAEGMTAKEKRLAIDDMDRYILTLSREGLKYLDKINGFIDGKE